MIYTHPIFGLTEIHTEIVEVMADSENQVLQPLYAMILLLCGHSMHATSQNEFEGKKQGYGAIQNDRDEVRAEDPGLLDALQWLRPGCPGRLMRRTLENKFEGPQQGY